MGLGTIRTLMDELRMRYGRAMDINVCTHSMEKSNNFDFSVMPYGSYLILGMSLWTTVCHYGSHKDIRDVTDDLLDGKDDP